MNNTTRVDSIAAEDPLSNYEPRVFPTELERVLAEETVDALPMRPYGQIEPSAPIHRAIKQLNETGTSSLLVVSEGRLVGIITERDVLERVSERYGKIADLPVRQFMTADPTVVYQTDPVAAAVAAIAVAGYRHVPVLGVDDTVMGILSPRRVFSFLEPYL